MAEIMQGRELEDRDNKPDYRADFFNMYKMMRNSKAAEDLQPNQLAFLSAYSILGNVTQSAKCVDIHPGTVSTWKREHEKFDEYYKMADTAHSHYLQSEAQRRAVEGIKEPVFYKGEIVGHKTKYSDNLLMFLMKGKDPERYRDNARIEVTGDGGGPIQIEFKPPDMDEELEVVDEDDYIEGDYEEV